MMVQAKALLGTFQIRQKFSEAVFAAAVQADAQVIGFIIHMTADFVKAAHITELAGSFLQVNHRMNLGIFPS